MSKIYTEVRSGLGNQLFQFAFGYALARTYNKELILCPAYYDGFLKYWAKKLLGKEVRSFKLPLILQREFPNTKITLTNKIINDPGLAILRETDIDMGNLDDIVLSKSDIYLKGYWQRPQLFAAYQHELTKLVKPSFKLSSACQRTLDVIDQNVVGIHVRRGDFLTNRSFGACTIDYYLQAIQQVGATIENPTFLVFTNSPAWVKRYFPAHIKYSIYSSGANENSDIEEFYLMTKLRSLIISNSTFSWWAAYLSAAADVVICPSKWFLKKELQENAPNFISTSWIVIDNQLELKN